MFKQSSNILIVWVIRPLYYCSFSITQHLFQYPSIKFFKVYSLNTFQFLLRAAFQHVSLCFLFYFLLNFTNTSSVTKTKSSESFCFFSWRRILPIGVCKHLVIRVVIQILGFIIHFSLLSFRLFLVNKSYLFHS